MESMKCPDCGAPLHFEENQEYCYCFHCGSQIYRQNVNKQTFTYRKIDEARIKEAEVKGTIEIAKLKSEEKSSFWLIIILFAMLLGFIVIMIILGHITDSKNDQARKEKEAQGMITAGTNDEACIDQNYEVIKAQFEARGFTNIELIDLNDAGIFKNKENTVAGVSIGGDDNFSNSEYFYPDDKVIISYH